MKRYIMLTKKRGETPLMAVSAWKKDNPEYRDVSASYAGRLDPMAQGRLLILLGDECKKQKAYTGLDKEYEIEVLFDVGSDTGDALGLVTSSRKETKVEHAVLRAALKRELGTHLRAYPRFSSKTVDGKPLFLHSLEGSTPTIPEHEEQLYHINLLETKTFSQNEVQDYVEEFLKVVPHSDEPSKVLGADFRINDVRASWEKVFAQTPRTYAIVRLRVICGSGTYMRSLAARIGEAFGTSALALSITRTKIGKYWKGLWLKSY